MAGFGGGGFGGHFGANHRVTDQRIICIGMESPNLYPRISARLNDAYWFFQSFYLCYIIFKHI
jgi:hypothetical protein